MNRRNLKKMALAMAAISTFAMTSGSTLAMTAHAEELDCVWQVVDGKSYWYEHNEKQGTSDDAKGVWYEGTNRGREIYDGASDGWYWLDSVYDGAKAEGKEVFMPYIYSNESSWKDNKSELDKNANASDEGLRDYVRSCIKAGTGKWVRYDENGKMLKGWTKISGALAEKYPTQVGNIYYYDTKTGLMAKGDIKLGGVKYHFDETTGALTSGNAPAGLGDDTKPSSSDPAPTPDPVYDTAPDYAINVRDFGAIPDDGIDDTNQINEAINEITYNEDAHNTVFIPAGNYDISIGQWGGIFAKPNLILILDPNAVLNVGATDKEEYGVININTSEDNVTISGGKLNGGKDKHQGTSGEGGHGIVLKHGCKNVTIKNMEIYNNWADGIYVKDGADGVNIIGCNIHDNRRSGISLIRGTNITIDSTKITNCKGHHPESCINIEPNSEDYNYGIPVTNVVIKRSTLKSFRDSDLNSNYMTFRTHNNGHTSDNIQISDTLFDGDVINCSATNLKLTNCKITGSFDDWKGSASGSFSAGSFDHIESADYNAAEE